MKKLEKKDDNLFFEATMNSSLENALEFIIKKYDDVNVVDSEQRTILIWSAIYGDLDLTNNIVEYGADVNFQDKSGKSALHMAAQKYHSKIAELLIENGANIEIRDYFGNTPLNDAVFYSNGRGDIIRLLLKNNANKNNKNNYGVSPLDLANTIANYDVKQFFN